MTYRNRILLAVVIVLYIITWLVLAPYINSPFLESIVNGLALAFFAAFFIIPIWAIVRSLSKVGELPVPVEKPRGEIQPGDMPLFSAGKINYTLDRLGDPSVTKGQGVLTVENTYAVMNNFSFNGDNIRWLGDRRGRGEVILDIDKDGWWYTLNIQAGSKANALVDALREIAPDNVNTARYRRRPNIRSKAADGFSVTQNLQGIWERDEKVQLVVTPLWFVAFHEGRVLHEVHIDTIEGIHCSKHPASLEDEALLFTFSTTDGERYAYQIYDADVAERLENVSRELLDTAPLRKKKLED